MVPSFLDNKINKVFYSLEGNCLIKYLIFNPLKEYKNYQVNIDPV